MATTTATPERVTVTRIGRDDWDGEEVASGQHVSFGALGFFRPTFDELPDYHPALEEWDKMLDEVFEELHPRIADLFDEAINRRLPWTWDPER